MGNQNIQNVLLLSLSTIKKDEIDKFSTYQYIDEDGKPNTVIGNYQLDPIPNMLKKKHIQLDYVIMLETEATKKEVDIVVEKENFCDTTTIAEYFKGHLADKMSDQGHIKEINLDERSPEHAIYEAFSYLAELSKDAFIHLYIDTHGGFRGVQLLLSAISSLLDVDRFQITPYAVQYDPGNMINTIVPDKTVQIFDFASGIQEFTTHGTVKTLLKYLSIEENGELINPIQEISDGITWCNIDNFTDGLAHLRNYYKKRKTIDNDYLRLFEARIKEDYGSLLDAPVPDAIDIANWCMKKGLYQQALTVIEAKTADSFISHNIIKLTETGKSLIGKDLTTYGKVTNHEILNGAMFQYNLDDRLIWRNDCRNFNLTFKVYSPIGIEGTTSGANSLKEKLREVKSLINLANIDTVELLKTAQNVSLQGRNNISIYKDAIELPLVNKPKEKSNTPADNDYLDALTVLLFMYKTMKDIRNMVNHAVDNPYKQNAIVNSIYFFIDLATFIYQETKKRT